MAVRWRSLKASGVRCSGSKCRIARCIPDYKDKDTRDAAMIAAAQAVEHYEITCRGPTSGQRPLNGAGAPRWSSFPMRG
ncbi:MAG: DUF892 family protein [Hyphomicrobium sp.]|nr:DUF892 family protein [Hyphomicrobium sp.]